MRIAVVTPKMKSGEVGGAEALYDGLVGSLRQASHEVDHVEVVIDESTFDAILESYLACYELDLGDYDLVVSTKAPTYMVRHRNHVSYLLHTIRVFYDMFEREFGAGNAELHLQRKTVHTLDKMGLHPALVRKHFTNGHQTYKRIYEADPFWRRVKFQALHHPPALDGFREPRRGEYIFLPSRLHRWKRVDLVINAFKHLKRDIQLKISGTGEDEATLRELAGRDSRIEFLGRVGKEQLLDLYAGALAVPFVPQNEDYGLITIEAFKSQKPVITCLDSGEPLYFVRDYENGFVVEPRPEAVAERLEYLIDHPLEAAEMGQRGFSSVTYISWETIVSQLASPSEPEGHASRAVRATKPNGHGKAHAAEQSLKPAFGNGHARASSGHKNIQSARQKSVNRERYKTLVLDMQPIEPPTGGGRIRLLGLYHGLGENLPTTYIGTYDWPGEKYRRFKHSETLEEITVPLSAEHFDACAEWQERAGGKTIIDTCFPLLAHKSAEFLSQVREAVADAEIVVFSHPWVYPLVKDLLKKESQLIVYDSHNVEGVLRAILLDDGGFGTELVKNAAQVEYELCQEAHLVLACSHEDREIFNDLYGVPFEKIVVVPNGTFTRKVAPSDEATRTEMKRKLGLDDKPLVIFLGSAYGPNIEAAEFISKDLAPSLPEANFAICGSVGEALDASVAGSKNLRVTGFLSEEDKAAYLAAADIAVNPMFSGSGTNVKMFDFMAMGLPVVSTPVGARGIAQGPEPAFWVRNEKDFVQAVKALLAAEQVARKLGEGAHRLVDEAYSWERISEKLGLLLHRCRRKLNERRPFFSVIIPSYERHEMLADLFERLKEQTCQDFEVIVVDQSQSPWEGHANYPELDVLYIHTDVKGAVGARNAGAFHARGEVLAFTDDDCLPFIDWLENARRYFGDPAVVGVEGLILSDKRDDPNYRAVTNENFEGVGFMTANLFLRRATFMAIDGFDARFDHPHFREDTDLGWRALGHGDIPFGRDVRVYHPPHLRAEERESFVERNRFFEKDPLLFAKHPERYRSLFLSESHYLNTPGFAENFLRGVEKYQVSVDDFYMTLLRQAYHEERS